MQLYNVHIGDTDRNWLRIVKITAKHSFHAAKICGVSEGEHILRVATPEQDERMCRREGIGIHQIYARFAQNEKITGGKSLTDGFSSLREKAEKRG